ncbi:unnamed protein product [Didymodactylos carnosus]|uniref:Uncharacterized protein n=1 Tax=Didymodactylos carnosus TaxID=1234261 RepID=A0A815G686_9BILA|nr:unnamed protein product [Didymodactylos carnosus]CAF4190664.1 unnamed protein product [Didymodactylos carnosus]
MLTREVPWCSLKVLSTDEIAKSPVVIVKNHVERQTPPTTSIIRMSNIVTPPSSTLTTITESRQNIPAASIVQIDEPKSTSNVTIINKSQTTAVQTEPSYSNSSSVRPPPGRFWPDMRQLRQISESQSDYQVLPPSKDVVVLTERPAEIVKTTNIINDTVTDVLRPVPTVETKTIVTKPTIVATDSDIVSRRRKSRYKNRSYRNRRRSIASTASTYSSYSTTSGTLSSARTLTPRPHRTQQRTIIHQPTVVTQPIQTQIITEPMITVVPHRRLIRRVKRAKTQSGYYSSDLDHGFRRVYKSDYKYRHYYYCNWFKGRCDLKNRSCGCCEWFYGCPVWMLVLLMLLFLGILVAFFTLLGLQPTINAARRSQTAQNRLLNKTVIVYGFLENCGYGTAGAGTTLPLCINTISTTTVQQFPTLGFEISPDINSKDAAL